MNGIDVNGSGKEHHSSASSRDAREKVYKRTDNKVYRDLEGFGLASSENLSGHQGR